MYFTQDKITEIFYLTDELDPFSGTIVSASNKIKYDVKQIRIACQEIVSINDDNFNEQSERIA